MIGRTDGAGGGVVGIESAADWQRNPPAGGDPIKDVGRRRRRI